MHIVLVEWKIKRGEEDRFRQYWRSEVPINDRSELVGEFLSAVTCKSEAYPWITWFAEGNSDYSHFINVAMWSNADAFHRQIGKYFDPASGPKDFEFELRRRSLLSPECWRMGDFTLPKHDSGGVL
jgi:hypothetical protein